MTVQCKHWTKEGDRVVCLADRYPDPSERVCLFICKENTTPPSRGLGDTVKKIIDRVTFRKAKPCGGCKKRREALNKLIPYGDKDNGR